MVGPLVCVMGWATSPTLYNCLWSWADLSPNQAVMQSNSMLTMVHWKLAEFPQSFQEVGVPIWHVL